MVSASDEVISPQLENITSGNKVRLMCVAGTATNIVDVTPVYKNFIDASSYQTITIVLCQAAFALR